MSAAVALCLVAVLLVDLGVHGSVARRVAERMHVRTPDRLEHVFWDAEPYAVGINRYNAGVSPYTLDDLWNPLPFAYPPVFVWVGGGLARGLGAAWGWRVYLGLYLVCMLLLQMMSGAVFLGARERAGWGVLVCVAPLGLFLSKAFLSGNIHVIWYALAALAAVGGVKS